MVLTGAPGITTAPAEEDKLLCTGKMIPPVDVEEAEPVMMQAIEQIDENNLAKGLLSYGRFQNEKFVFKSTADDNNCQTQRAGALLQFGCDKSSSES